MGNQIAYPHSARILSRSLRFALIALSLPLVGCTQPRQAFPLTMAPYRLSRTWALVDGAAASRLQILGSLVEIKSKGFVAWQCDQAAITRILQECGKEQKFYRTETYAYAQANCSTQTAIWSLNEQPAFVEGTDHDYLQIGAFGGEFIRAFPGKVGLQVHIETHGRAKVNRTQREQAGDGGSLEDYTIVLDNEIVPGRALVAVGRVSRAAGIDFYLMSVWTASIEGARK